MRRLLCRVGVHSPVWQPAYSLDQRVWLRALIRMCSHCGRYIGRRPH